MKIKYKDCRNCGKSWTPNEDINANQSYCTNCSLERKQLADKMHMLDKRKVIQSGPYVFLSSPLHNSKDSPISDEWHLTGKFSGRKKPRR